MSITQIKQHGFVLDRESLPKAVRKLVKTVKPSSWVDHLDGWAFPLEKLADVDAFLSKHGVKRAREEEGKAEPPAKRARLVAPPAAAAVAPAVAAPAPAAVVEIKVGSNAEEKQPPLTIQGFNSLQGLPDSAPSDCKIAHLNIRRYKCEDCGHLSESRSATNFHNPFGERCMHVDFDGQIGCDHCAFPKDSKWLCYACAACKEGCDCDGCVGENSDEDDEAADD